MTIRATEQDAQRLSDQARIAHDAFTRASVAARGVRNAIDRYATSPDLAKLHEAIRAYESAARSAHQLADLAISTAVQHYGYY